MSLMNLEITNHFCLLGVGNRTETIITIASRLGSHENGLTLETTKQSSYQRVFLALPVPKSGRKNFQFSTGAAAWDGASNDRQGPKATFTLSQARSTVGRAKGFLWWLRDQQH